MASEPDPTPGGGGPAEGADHPEAPIGAPSARSTEPTLARELLAILVLYGFVSVLPLLIGSCSGL